MGAAVTGSGYKVGSPARMGPGFMPVVPGVVLAFLGILIAGTALGSSEAADKKFLPDNPQWFGWLCILGGPVLLGPRFEENFRRSLLISRGDLTIFIERPISYAARYQHQFKSWLRWHAYRHRTQRHKQPDRQRRRRQHLEQHAAFRLPHHRQRTG